MKTTGIRVDPDIKDDRVLELEDQLRSRVVGQYRAVNNLCQVYQKYLAGMTDPRRPIGTMLFLGPTGTGKTRTVEAAAEILFENPNAVIKIDCAEFQHSHEIAKLIGSPPGFTGHRETSPRLTQENLYKASTKENNLSFVLFDEIEKASESLWDLLLAILDRATLTLGDNRRVDFSKTIIVMTSNLGAQEMSKAILGGLGFAPKRISKKQELDELDTTLYRIALEAAKRKFRPEFMNRMDKVVVFRRLHEPHLKRILDIELTKIQDRITELARTKFVFTCQQACRKVLLDKGTDLQWGARELKRVLERSLVFPFANMVCTQQIETGDVVDIDFDEVQEKFIFRKLAGKVIIPEPKKKVDKTEDLKKLGRKHSVTPPNGAKAMSVSGFTGCTLPSAMYGFRWPDC